MFTYFFLLSSPFTLHPPLLPVCPSVHIPISVHPPSSSTLKSPHLPHIRVISPLSLSHLDCAACVFNRADSDCKRPMKWTWRGEYTPSGKAEVENFIHCWKFYAIFFSLIFVYHCSVCQSSILQNINLIFLSIRWHEFFFKYPISLISTLIFLVFFYFFNCFHFFYFLWISVSISEKTIIIRKNSRHCNGREE